MKPLFLFLVFPFFAISQTPAPQSGTYVNDLTGNLTPDQTKALNEQLLSLERSSSVQMAVELINSLPENVQIEDYARDIGRKWHVGNARNGIVYVAAIDQHKQRLEIAEHLEGDIPDAEALNITDAVKPFFRQKDYYGGLKELVTRVNIRINPVAKEQQKLALIKRSKKEDQTKHSFIGFLLIAGWIALVLLTCWLFYLPFYTKRKKDKESQQDECENSNNFRPSTPTQSTATTSVLPLIIPLSTTSNDSYSGSRDKTASDDSSSSSSSDYGNWGSSDSGSSDSSSSDSGFSGGGASNDW